MAIMNSKRDIQRWAEEEIRASDDGGSAGLYILTEIQLREAVEELADKVCEAANALGLEWGEDWSGLLDDLLGTLLVEDIVDALDV